ncbi:MAG TPA: hypothetical protein VK711_01620 [Puia sp.]|nr:hypothetical protein [Puia sp.]
MALKIPLLLVEYLYKNRKMALPGLGIFTLDKSVVLPEENDRTLLSMPNAVQFQNANIAAADKELISFICENTGKIKPLAISDLDSYLNLGTEMLNIGKPFHLEGIGTITKNKTGKFDFTPGEYTVIKENTPGPEHGKKKLYPSEKKQLNTPPSIQNRNMLKVVALLAALVIVGLGGWMMYKKNNSGASGNNPDTASAAQTQLSSASDSLAADSAARRDSAKNLTKDSIHPSIPHVREQPSTYKFIILSTYNKTHALKRYKQLVGFDLKAHLYQKDSTFFKVYFQFPALAKDTIQIKDSLRKQYAHDVTIEQ